MSVWNADKDSKLERRLIMGDAWSRSIKAREDQSRREMQWAEAVRMCRAAAEGREGANYDLFFRISGRTFHGLDRWLENRVSAQEYGAWKAAYEADAGPRAVRKAAAQEEQIQQDIGYCRSAAEDGEMDTADAFDRLECFTEVFDGGLSAFLVKYSVSKDEWSDWEGLVRVARC